MDFLSPVAEIMHYWSALLLALLLAVVTTNLITSLLEVPIMLIYESFQSSKIVIVHETLTC